ncbi:outer membrane protein assembly factor BamD [Halorhodospira halochloris]|uniref:Outer membrane protein assembly factor BamD n=1 Tax=Halorhodospira halochloris TaxID=1052 RepID=A0A0X8X7G3_HALHR|nr:outer membrane protein assembly factor BamD [Halorhodospira halochloris]MCG5529726.1 outer membrane protein assembly factor BamD [Halorhodospira halochloris]BAU56896.1 probable component of the lipoprotein assembly complex (forms a complex with YaeT [Halorhodospira halochloris]
MLRWITRCTLMIALLLGTAGLGGCAGTPEDSAEVGVAQLYDRAMDSLGSGNYSEAINRFESLIARYPFGDYSVQSQLMIIYAHHLAGQHQSAIAAADRFIRMHPQDENVAYAIYMRGVSRQSIGPGGLGQLLGVDANLRDPEPKRRAFFDFQELVRDFPDSEYTDNAYERMEDIREQLAAYELYITDFYLERGAYIAAANRAGRIISGYPGTAVVDDAMQKLADSYRGLELYELGDEVEQEIARRHEVDVEDVPDIE